MLNGVTCFIKFNIDVSKDFFKIRKLNKTYKMHQGTAFIYPHNNEK